MADYIALTYSALGTRETKSTYAVAGMEKPLALRLLLRGREEKTGYSEIAVETRDCTDGALMAHE